MEYNKYLLLKLNAGLKILNRSYSLNQISTAFLKKRFIKSTFLMLLIILFSIPTMGFFSLFTSNEESTIPFPIPEITVDSLGKASASIEIPLPPATADIKPTINLNYSSGAGNGILGVGWELGGMETIVRDPVYGVQLNANDHFLSSNVGQLSYNSSNAPYYYSRRESFHRFEPVFDGSCSGGPCGWIEKLPDGITNYYGVADSSGDDFNSKIKAEGTNVVKIWALNRVRDRHGNGYDIRYLSSSLTNQYSPIPYQITYNQGAVLVEFEYEGRNDIFSNFALGGRYRLNSRLSGIQVSFQNSTIDQWDLSYTYSPNQQSQLSSISKTNYDLLNLSYTTGNLSFSSGVDHTAKSFVGLDFNAYYKPSDNGACSGAMATCLLTAVGANPLAALFCAFVIADQSVNCNRGIEKNYTAFVDVTGDERPDFVRLSPAGYQAIDPNLPPSNLLSYALAKIVVNPTSVSGSSVQVGSGTFESPAFRYTEATKIIPGDINGDGRMDFYIVEDYDLNLKLAISTGSGFNLVVTNIQTVMPRPDKQRWFYLRPDQNSYQFASDMNGDARTDFIQKVGSNLIVYFSNGNSLDSSSSNVISPSVYGAYGQSGQVFTDIDGNGIGDFIRFNNIDNPSTRELRYTLFDESGNAISRSFRSVQNNGKDGNAFFVDINGDALVDFVSVTPSGALTVYLFDGKNYATSPYQVGMNGVHPIEDSTQYMSPATANPYLLDVKRDGGPLDKLIETNTLLGQEEITIYLHDNSSQFTESFSVVAHLPDNVYSGDAPSTAYDIDKDGQNETIYIHFYYNVFNQQVMALRIHFTSDNTDYEQAIDANALYTASTFAEQPNYPALTSSLYDSWRLSKTFAEVNGDGLADFIWFDGSTIRISFGVLAGDRIEYNSNGDTQISASSFYTAMDLNRDGKADLIGIDSARNEIFNVVNFLSINSDTAVSMTGVIHFYSKVFSEPIGLLKTVNNGIGQKSKTISYLNSFEMPGAIAPNLSSYPVIPYDSTDVLARSVISDYGGNETSITCFNYLNHRYFSGIRDARRNLGFEKITSNTSLNYAPLNCSDPNPLRTNEKYAIQNGTFETDGIVFRNIDFYLGTIVSDDRSFYASVNSPFGTKYAQLNQSIQDTYQGGILLTSQNTSYSYGDLYGNPTLITETLGSNTVTTQVSYLNDPANWILGSPLLQRKVSNGLLVQDRFLTYYSNSDVSSIQDFPGKPEYSVQSFSVYDSYGNPLSIRDGNNNLMSFQYDIVVNKFPIQITNSLGQTIQKEYDLSKGLETKMTDPNGAVTIQNYDKFGRPNETILPGESSWSTRIIYDKTGQPGQTIQKLKNDSQNGDLVTKEFYDTLGRSIRKETPVDGGRILVSTSEYNSDGSLKQKIKTLYRRV
ncbi:SpvB/TcaC N-terminal domain-containing protein [Leptospira stimsonii]|uniref:Insecticide toxin TcdB middle/N-terminal domain-containing protein n=1 Tax=Leptospira stimsonii TaxID=2202203 RepID=A0A8B3CIN4_9LEPT|nr:SpvB/TcaC N-terminal domain-containing protein [Leptospira stimsonii]RHX83282.1 hypothetical protein DLM78_22535 [Leptospira stimsonii]